VAEGLRFRVCGYGFSLQGPEFRVECLGSRVWRPGSRV
jgi:hypothetical protein